MIRPRSRGGLRTWLRTWWLTVPEPRHISVGWGVAYLMLGLAGYVALSDPPTSLVSKAGQQPIILSLGCLNVAGMVIAMISGWRDFWKGERLGIGLMIGAACIYASLIVALGISQGGSRGVQFFYVAFVLVVLGVRYLMIRWFTYRPREE